MEVDSEQNGGGVNDVKHVESLVGFDDCTDENQTHGCGANHPRILCNVKVCCRARSRLERRRGGLSMPVFGIR
jgi:hypothetical protein